MNRNEKVARRISQILTRLNQGQRLKVQDLLEEFGISERTCERDFERLDFLDWEEKGRGFYKLDCKKSGFLTEEDIVRFANFASISMLLPEIDKDFFAEKLTQSVKVKGVNYEDIQNKKKDFLLVSECIKSNQNISFYYCKSGQKEGKFYKLSPYSLINKNGIWYVIGTDSDKQKTFCFTQMQKITPLNEHFVPNETLLEQIKSNDSISYGNQLKEIVVQVSPFASPYFKRRNLLPNQELVHKLDDGGLLLSCKNVNELDVVPLVQYWIPHLTIISPKELQDKMEQRLQSYLNQSGGNR